MNLVTQLFVMIAVLFHAVAFVLESFLFHRPNVQTFLLGKPEPAAGVRLWAFNQGFYNLFLAAGPAARPPRALRRAPKRRSSAPDLWLCLHGGVRRRPVHLRPTVVAQHDRLEWPTAHRAHRGARVTASASPAAGSAARAGGEP
jgi:hypothetical protein